MSVVSLQKRLPADVPHRGLCEKSKTLDSRSFLKHQNRANLAMAFCTSYSRSTGQPNHRDPKANPAAAGSKFILDKTEFYPDPLILGHGVPSSHKKRESCQVLTPPSPKANISPQPSLTHLRGLVKGQGSSNNPSRALGPSLCPQAETTASALL